VTNEKNVNNGNKYLEQRKPQLREILQFTASIYSCGIIKQLFGLCLIYYAKYWATTKNDIELG